MNTEGSRKNKDYTLARFFHGIDAAPYLFKINSIIMKHILFLFAISLITAFVAITQSQAQHRGRGAVVTRPAHHVVARQAHVHYSGMPRWGTTIHAVPHGAVSLRYRRNPYYYHEGIYYAPRNGGYAIVRPSWGLRINVLPMGYRTIALGPRNFYYYYGTYYQPSGNGYVVVRPPVGAVVDSLPDGYEVANINGIEYYVLDHVTYAEVDAPEYPDGVGYEVISN